MKPTPYWWEDAPRPSLPAFELPARVDVAVVGSGYTGLSAALTLARAGREVLVCDAEQAGWGASSRNQGHVGLFTRSSFADLTARYGSEKAVALVREGLASVAFTLALIENEGIACHMRRSGRFIAAATTAAYDKLAREGEAIAREVGGFDHTMVGRDAMQRDELASDAYVGGQIRLGEAGLHGGLYHLGLLERVTAAGARVATETRVEAIERDSAGFHVRTSRGTFAARDVMIATDALGGKLVPFLARRVIPVGAGGIATSPLPRETIERVIPGLRPMVDTWKVGNSIRPSPDLTRIIFGGRRTMTDSDPETSGRKLARQMTRLFPQLDGVEVTHSWLGKVGYTFQTMPHTGTFDGLHYAMGYCGYGVAMATYLGHKTAQRILRANDAATAYDDLPFDTRPLYDGRPWFLPLTLLWYRWIDLRTGWSAGR